MKRILFFILMSVLPFKTVADGKFYISTFTNNVILENINGNSIITNSPISKQTYDCKNNYTFLTSTNSDVTLTLSSDIIIKINENSRFSIDTFDQKILNIESLPDVIQYTTENINTSLNGTIYLYNENTSPILIATEMGTVAPKKGKFFIRSEEKSLMVIVLEGEAVVFDGASKREQIIKEKNMVVVVPSPKFQGRAAEQMIKKANIFTIKSLEDADLKDILNDINTMTVIEDNIKFIVINKEIFGVKIR
jgi:type III secretion system FlhB-like substrate exporter